MSTNPQHAQYQSGGPMSETEYIQLEQRSFNTRYEYLNDEIYRGIDFSEPLTEE